MMAIKRLQLASNKRKFDKIQQLLTMSIVSEPAKQLASTMTRLNRADLSGRFTQRHTLLPGKFNIQSGGQKQQQQQQQREQST